MWRDLAWPVFNGLFDLIAAATLLMTGVGVGRSLLVGACGLGLLVGAWRISADMAVVVRLAALAFATVGVACAAFALVYLTHDADALPRLLPGYDTDSERWLLAPGMMSLMVAGVMTCAAYASVQSVS